MYYINYVGTYKVLRFLSNKVSGFSFNDPGRIYKKYENIIISRNVIIFLYEKANTTCNDKMSQNSLL